MKLTVKGLSFSYQASQILDDICFEANAKQTVAILGTNGAGKTTLLRCIDRILRFESGEICVDNNNIKKMKASELAKEIGYVQQAPIFPDCTVFEAVLIGRRPYMKWEASENDLKLTESLLYRLGLSDIAFRNINEISGGERQKTAIARALAQQPGVLLFDEPINNLDLKNQYEVLKLINEISQTENMTVVLTMHDINLALRFADTFILMKDKRIFAAGDKSVITEASVKEVYGVDVHLTEILGNTIIIPK